MDKRKKINQYLSKLKNGEDCFDEFYRFASAYVEYMAWSVLFDKSYVEDVLVNTFNNIIRSVKTFNPDRNGYNWILTIAKNEAYKINERVAVFDVPLDDISYDVAAPTDIEAASTLSYDVYCALNRLNKIDKIIVENSVILGKTYEETSKEVGLSVSAICKRLKKSLKLLEDFLK